MTTVWETRDTTFADFAAQTGRGEWVLDPEHQRDVVHNDTWKSGVINSALKIGDIPQVYFHTVTDEEGLSLYESLDGKQRCSAIVDFLEGRYTFTPETAILEQHEECVGKTFREFPALARQQLSRTKLSCKIITRTMTDEEISEFFLVRQVTKVTTAGEKLNAQLKSRIRPQATELLSRTIVTTALNSVKKAGNRKGHVELLARLMFAHRHPDILNLDPSPKDLTNWWGQADPFNAEELNLIEALIKRMVTLVLAVPAGWCWSKHAKTTLLPVYNTLQKYCTGENSEAGFEAMTARLSSGQENAFVDILVAGDHDVTNRRRVELRDACFAFPPIEEEEEEEEEEEDFSSEN